MANTHKLETRPKYEMGIIHTRSRPGHHLQISLAQELEDIPMFRDMVYILHLLRGLYSENWQRKWGFMIIHTVMVN